MSFTHTRSALCWTQRPFPLYILQYFSRYWWIVVVIVYCSSCFWLVVSSDMGIFARHCVVCHSIFVIFYSHLVTANETKKHVLSSYCFQRIIDLNARLQQANSTRKLKFHPIFQSLPFYIIRSLQFKWRKYENDFVVVVSSLKNSLLISWQSLYFVQFLLSFDLWLHRVLFPLQFYCLI